MVRVVVVGEGVAMAWAAAPEVREQIVLFARTA